MNESPGVDLLLEVEVNVGNWRFLDFFTFLFFLSYHEIIMLLEFQVFLFESFYFIHVALNTMLSCFSWIKGIFYEFPGDFVWRKHCEDGIFSNKNLIRLDKTNLKGYFRDDWDFTVMMRANSLSEVFESGIWDRVMIVFGDKDNFI